MITIDIIGSLHSDIITDAAGDYLSGGEPLPGFHINTIPEVPGWEQYRVEPASKRRVFAGMEAETVCYVFPDEAAFRAEAITLGLLQESEDETL